jgi:hypothetical protein
VSAREAYPAFLSFQDTLGLQVGWAGRGFVDAFRWDIVVRLIARNVGFSQLVLLFFLTYDAVIRAAMQRSARTRSSRSC